MAYTRYSIYAVARKNGSTDVVAVRPWGCQAFRHRPVVPTSPSIRPESPDGTLSDQPARLDIACTTWEDLPFY